MRLTKILSLIIAAGILSCSGPAWAVEYRFCVICNNHRANALVSSGRPDLGKEWFRVKTAQTFAKAYNSQSCSANDFDTAMCGGDREESLNYTAINGEQIEALLSGNPITMGQAAVEIVTGIPATAADAIQHGVKEGEKIIKRIFH
jgi:hypothetical protein